MEHAPQTPGWAEPAPGADEDTPTTADPAPVEPSAQVDEPSGTALVEQGVRVATGMVAIGVAALAEAVRRTLPTPAPSDEPAVEHADPLGLATGALLGSILLAGEGAARAVGRVSSAIGPPASWFAGVPPLGPAAAWVRDAAGALDARWRAARPQTETAATAFARELVPEVIDAVLDQLDLTWLVAERVDLDELVARVDLDRVVSRVDLDAIVHRLDLDALASRIDVDAVVARVDLDAIVRRVDIDGVAERIDLDAVIARIDLPELARSVIEEIDLPEVIRDSTGSMASETVRGVRIQGIEADAAVSRAMDRMLLRRRSRETDAPGEPESLDDARTDDDRGTRT
jgi:hypothetical protein